MSANWNQPAQGDYSSHEEQVAEEYQAALGLRCLGTFLLLVAVAIGLPLWVLA